LKNQVFKRKIERMIMDKMLKQKIKKLPQKPGVYLFKDVNGRIIYIGKAANIKKRVQTHFAETGNFFSSQFAGKVADIDYIKTANENEALLLENELIKKYQPRFNIQWRDDKSYFWVRFTNDEWPRVIIVHRNKIIRHSERSEESPTNVGRHKAGDSSVFDLRMTDKFIGPFVSGRELRRVLSALRKISPFRTCKNPYNKPCLQWHLGLCPAHSTPLLPEQARRARRRLDPSTSAAYGGLRSGNKLKNYINSLNSLSQILRLYAGEPIRIEAYDISNIQGDYATGSLIVFYGNRPQKNGYRKFRIKTVRGANDVAMIREILKRRFTHKEWPYPNLILIDGGIAQLNAANDIFTKVFERSSKNFSKYASDNLPPVIALAKREEEIYTEYSDKTLHLRKLPESLKLIFKAVRDEAHRFAIFYHRYLHSQVVKIRQVRRRRTK